MGGNVPRIQIEMGVRSCGVVGDLCRTTLLGHCRFGMKGDLPSEFDILPIRALTAEIHEVTGVHATDTPLAMGFRIHEEKRNLGGWGGYSLGEAIN